MPLYRPPDSVSERFWYMYVPPPLTPWYFPVPLVLVYVYSFRCEPSSQVRDIFPLRIVVRAGSGALPAPIGHVFVVSDAVLTDRRFRGIVRDKNAAHGSIYQLVSFLRLLDVPLVVHAGHGACILDRLTRICASTAENAQGYGRRYEQLLEVHIDFLSCNLIITLIGVALGQTP